MLVHTDVPRCAVSSCPLVNNCDLLAYPSPIWRRAIGFIFGVGKLEWLQSGWGRRSCLGTIQQRDRLTWQMRHWSTMSHGKKMPSGCSVCCMCLPLAGTACSSSAWLPRQPEGDWQWINSITNVTHLWTAARYCCCSSSSGRSEIYLPRLQIITPRHLAPTPRVTVMGSQIGWWIWSWGSGPE